MLNNKVLIIMCGGVINMRVSDDGALYYNSIDSDEKVIDEIYGLDNLAEIDVISFKQGHSYGLTEKHWDDVIDIIDDNYQTYDGFIVIMGTDTMAYMSAALSFALQGIGKPVIVTGARSSIFSIKTDARMNLINSVLTAVSNLSGVFLVFGDKIILGSRVRKISQTKFSSFSTFNKDDFAFTDSILLNTDLKEKKSKYKRHDRNPEFKKGFEKDIICLPVTPNINIKYIYRLIDENIKGLILQTFGSGNLPNHMLPVLKELSDKKIPVIITTQCHEGTTTLQTYNNYLIEAFDMSPECAYVKCMWMLGQNIPYEDFKLIFQTNMVDEIDRSLCDSILDYRKINYIQDA